MPHCMPQSAHVLLFCRHHITKLQLINDFLVLDNHIDKTIHQPPFVSFTEHQSGKKIQLRLFIIKNAIERRSSVMIANTCI